MHPSCEATALTIVPRINDFIRGRSTCTKDWIAQAVAYVCYILNGANVQIKALASQVNIPDDKLRKGVNALLKHLGMTLDKPIQDETESFSAALLNILHASRVRDGYVGVSRVARWCKELIKSMSTEEAACISFMNCAPEKQARTVLHMYRTRVDDPFVPGFSLGEMTPAIERCSKLLERALSKAATRT